MTIEINTNQVRIGTNFVAKKNAVLTSSSIITNVETENTLPQIGTTSVIVDNTMPWDDPNNITTIVETDFAFMSNLEDETTDSLEATKFGFAIPSNATIKGIQVQIRRKVQTASHILDVKIQLLKAGVPVGENKADLVNTWDSTGATGELVSYPKTGASTDLWGADWNYEDINHDDFGVYIVAKEPDDLHEINLTIFYVYIKIYYEIPEILKQYSKVIAVSYSTNNRITGDTVFNKVVIGGVPLSISAYSFGDNPSLFPDATIESNIYYALDIIEITETSDVEITTYDNNIFTWDGSRLSNLRLNNKNYINVSIQGNAGQPYHNTTIQGVPFALDENRCLIVNQSGYTFDNIEEIGEDPSNREPDIKELMVGGVPLSAGRIGNKYYLIVNALPAS